MKGAAAMSRTTQLYELQQVDTALDERVARHRSVTAVLNDTAEVDAARAGCQAAQAALTEAQVVARLLNGEIEDLTTKIAAEEKKLFGGAVKNPKELSSIEHEVAGLRKRKGEREDRLLEAMEALEARQTELTAAQEQLASIESIWQQRQAGLLEDKDQLETQLRALKVKRDRMVATVPWADLTTYDRIRRAKHGVAVASVLNDICQSCRVTVPNVVLRQVKISQEFALCPSCNRILHMPGRGELVTG
jgi:predicted  nucleic acid-binding Zn-ribbon protein